MQGSTVGGGGLEDEEWQEETFRYPYERGGENNQQNKTKQKKENPHRHAA